MTQSTTKSFRAMVEEADPDFYKAKRETVAYRFSNGRKFFDKIDPYAGTSTST